MNQKSNENAITLSEFLGSMLKEEKYAEEALKSNETKCCTFDEGYKDQELFGCRDCGVDFGFCLACYLECHLNHDTFEIGQKRSFRCDCGISKTSFECQIRPKKSETNEKNQYDHNFRNRFCICEVDYDGTEFVVRCLGCLDYFHAYHIGHTEEIQELITKDDQYHSMICSKCFNQKFKFLAFYPETVKLVEEQLRPHLTKTEESKIEEVPQKGSLLEKRQRPEDQLCKLYKKDLNTLDKVNADAAVFLTGDWNEALCLCDNCSKMYKKNGIYEIIVSPLKDDTVQEDIEEMDIQANPNADRVEIADESANSRQSTASTNNNAEATHKNLYELAVDEMSKLDYMTQVQMVGMYRDFYEDFKEFFRSFAENDKVITKQDVDNFFAVLRQKREQQEEIEHYD